EVGLQEVEPPLQRAARRSPAAPLLKEGKDAGAGRRERAAHVARCGIAAVVRAALPPGEGRRGCRAGRMLGTFNIGAGGIRGGRRRRRQRRCRWRRGRAVRLRQRPQLFVRPAGRAEPLVPAYVVEADGTLGSAPMRRVQLRNAHACGPAYSYTTDAKDKVDFSLAARGGRRVAVERLAVTATPRSLPFLTRCGRPSRGTFKKAERDWPQPSDSQKHYGTLSRSRPRRGNLV